MKDFKQWHLMKQSLEQNETVPRFNERDIWWCSLGENIGFEQDGKNERFERPILVLKKFNQETFLGVPMTSSIKAHPLRIPYTLNDTEWSINLTQCRTLSAKRLHRRMGVMGETKFTEILEIWIDSLRAKKAKTPNKSEFSQAPKGEM